MVEIISDAERIARMKKDLHDFVEAQFPFSRFFPSYGIGGKGAEEKTPEKKEAIVSSNEDAPARLKATISEKGRIQIEKNLIAEKAFNKRLNKAIKVKIRKGKATISLHRA